jgi:transposase-like protein
MTFVPPRCPNSACEYHLQPKPGFYRRRGSYLPRCRTEPVPRFFCRGCRRGFSRQTFRHDRGDRRPECNAPLFSLVTSGVGLRQIGRLLGLDINSVQRKHRKIARTCELLHGNLTTLLPEGRTYVIDEEETYEGASIRTVTMPVLIEAKTWFVVATATGSIRRLARPGTARRRRQDREERGRGRRPDESNHCVRKVLEQLQARTPSGPVVLLSDEKASYRSIARSVFGDRLEHQQTPGTLARTTYNPLFPINTTLAMTRDNCGRLRRRSWLVSKDRRYLAMQLHVFTVYRNYVRRRFNRDRQQETAAMLLGLLPRALVDGEVLSWRQDWGARSVHPISLDARRTVAEKLQVAA